MICADIKRNALKLISLRILKCKLKAKGKDLPGQVMKAQGRSKGTAALILHLDARCG
jgi:hypothetical protein